MKHISLLNCFYNNKVSWFWIQCFLLSHCTTSQTVVHTAGSLGLPFPTVRTFISGGQGADWVRVTPLCLKQLRKWPSQETGPNHKLARPLFWPFWDTRFGWLTQGGADGGISFPAHYGLHLKMSHETFFGPACAKVDFFKPQTIITN